MSKREGDGAFEVREPAHSEETGRDINRLLAQEVEYLMVQGDLRQQARQYNTAGEEVGAVLWMAGKGWVWLAVGAWTACEWALATHYACSRHVNFLRCNYYGQCWAYKTG